MTPPRLPDGSVRVTLYPGEDVLLRPGARVADVRAPLAALTRRPELRYAALVVEHEHLTDDQVIGERPLLPGAVVHVRDPDPAHESQWSGRGPWSAAGRHWLVVRVTGAHAGTVVGVDGPWAAIRTWTRLRRGGRLAVRRTSGPATWVAPPPEPAHSRVPWVLTLLPALVSLALAVTLRQPLLAVFSLVGLVAVLPQLRTARQRAVTGGTESNRSGELPGPARLLAFAHAALHISPAAWAAARDAWAAVLSARARTPRPSGPLPGPEVSPLWAAHDDPWEQLLHDGSVAVLGPPAPARAVARALVARLATRGAEVLVREHAPGWSWVRWLPGGGPRVLVLDDGPDHAVERPATRRPDRIPAPSGPAPAAGLVVSIGTVRPGCRTVVRVLDDRRVRLTGPDGVARVVPLVGVTTQWVEHLARLLAGAAWLGRTTAAITAGQGEASQLPHSVSLTRAHGLTVVPDPAALAARWNGGDGWTVPLGIGADHAAVYLDLIRDGPHLLVAGTTGSGKSELLQALVLGLAMNRSPTDLALVLVDFKGGTSLGPCPGLPHVVGQVSDLEPGLAGRALAGLRAELHRRERVLATHGVPDLAALPPGTLPRLVVVIDEFRALADDLPEFLPALLRVAAQGRSLGVHLVLATQRPGGAVGPDLRANVSARVALRVTDPLESRDVLDDPAAARISATTPGRAVLRLGTAAPVPLQCAHAAAPPEAELPLVRRAPAWPGPAPNAQPVAPAPDVATLVVDAARRAANMLGHEAGAPPWLAALPRRATATDLPPATRRRRRGLVLALGDDPGRQRRAAVEWDPAEGHLAILGRARSGRSTALVTLGLAALARGWSVHGIADDAASLAPLQHHPGYGGTRRPDDGAALARLLSRSGPRSGPDGGTDPGRARPGRSLVLVDGAEDVRGTLPAAALRSGFAFALSADGPSVGGLASRVGPRLVLLGNDRSADVVLGAPVLLAGSGGPPGRAVWCGRGEPMLCQVLDPDLAGASTGPEVAPGGTAPADLSSSALGAGPRGRREHGRRHEQTTDCHGEHKYRPTARHGDPGAAADRGDRPDDLEELPGHDRSAARTTAGHKGPARRHEDPGDTQEEEHQKDAHAHRGGTARKEFTK